VDGLKGVLLVLRFALEIGSLVALAYWGFTTGGRVVNVVLGIGAPLLAATVWGLFVSPQARFGSPLRQAAFEAVVFAAATLALLHTGKRRRRSSSRSSPWRTAWRCECSTR
jgi:Protein of unknown function (DUF2568)